MAGDSQEKTAKDRGKKTVPEPIRLAQEALNILASEGVDVSQGLGKSLPAYAMQLERSGAKVTVEILLADAREGKTEAKRENTQKKKTYDDVIAGFSNVIEQDEEGIDPLIKSIKAGNLDAVKKEVKKSNNINLTASLGWATYENQLEIVKYFVSLIKKQDKEDADAAYQRAAGYALHDKKLDILKYLIEDVGLDSHAQEALLMSAIRGGNLTVVKYLVEEHGADLRRQNGFVTFAAQNKRLFVLKYLTEKGADVHAFNERALAWAACNGDVSMAKYLVEEKGADVNARNGEGMLAYAVHSNSMEMLRHMVEEWRVDIHTADNRVIKQCARFGRMVQLKYLFEEQPAETKTDMATQLLKQAVAGDRLTAMQYLLDQGADPEQLSQRQKRQLDKALNSNTVWQKAVRTTAPKYLHSQNPAYFRPKTFEAVKSMMQKEDYRESDNKIIFAASALFGTEDRVLQYLEKWGKGGIINPLYNLIRDIKMPLKKIPDESLAAWADAVLKCGPAMAKFVQYADKVPMPEKSSDGKTWSMVNTREKMAKYAYTRGHKHPELANLCVEHGISEARFDKALRLALNAPAEKNIPQVTIDGKRFDMEGATFRPLAANDVRGLFLGELVDCCQSIGAVGEKCAVSGFKSEQEGFYVVENSKGRIIGEAWAWRGRNGELVLDSLETLGTQVAPEQWKKLTQTFARSLSQKKGCDVTALHIGMSGYAGTPDLVRKAFNEASTPAKPIGRAPYQDSKGQVVVWQRKAAAAQPLDRFT